MSGLAAATPRRVSTTSIVLAAAAVLAWAGTIAWVRIEDMQAMPGTMGMSLASFTVMWGLRHRPRPRDARTL